MLVAIPGIKLLWQLRASYGTRMGNTQMPKKAKKKRAKTVCNRREDTPICKTCPHAVAGRRRNAGAIRSCPLCRYDCHFVEVEDKPDVVQMP